jgi:hypothetical protein
MRRGRPVDLGEWLTWETVKSFGNSNFFTSSIGALAGAVGGAWAAQRIADKAKVRDQLLDEVRSCNIAIELAHGICSTFLNLKEQYVLRLARTYQEQRVRVHVHHEGLRTGAIPAGTVLDLGGLDLQTLGVIPIGVADLRAAVLQNVTAPARPRSLVAVLGYCIDTLNETIRTRNGQIAALRASNAPLNEKVPYIFGLPHDGIVDETFAHTVTALYKYTDDCIFFSKLLCSDLADHGDRLRAILKLHFRREAPRINRLIWDDVEKKGLLPPDANYTSWLTGFPRRVPKTYGRRWVMWWYAVRRLFRMSPAGRIMAHIRWWRLSRK